ncbi:hypothetical protein C0992_001052 [Termitomyces sp. T32_za158]|nr:hypothetical protein C0992_001052 [Termitomyces sp. T32_za158]
MSAVPSDPMSADLCNSNPDITGIGVRTAIYAQNIFSFFPAARVLWDGKVTRNELATIEQQSSTILITAFALLFSAIIQARSLGLSNFNAAIILNLSWMNNTNVFIYFLLYASRQLEKKREGLDGLRALLREVRDALKEPVFWIGSFHLSLIIMLESTNGSWTFGQTLAMLLLLVPARDFIEVLIECRELRQRMIKKLVENLQKFGSEEDAKNLLMQDPDDDVKGKK